MTNDIIVEFVEGRPFVPFEIYTADGRIIRVPHPEFVTLGRYAASLTIFEQTNHAEVIDAALIVSIRTLDPMS